MLVLHVERGFGANPCPDTFGRVRRLKDCRQTIGWRWRLQHIGSLREPERASLDRTGQADTVRLAAHHVVALGREPGAGSG